MTYSTYVYLFGIHFLALVGEYHIISNTVDAYRKWRHNRRMLGGL
jgi:hypothetical protein